MSEEELRKRIRAERQMRKNIPEGCRWSDCFHCVFDDCHYDRNSGSDNGIQDILRELSGVR